MGACPAKELEYILGIEGISANWKMPEGEDVDSVERKVHALDGTSGKMVNLLLFPIVEKRNSYPRNSVCYKIFDCLCMREDKRRAKLYNSVWIGLVKANPELEQVKVDKNSGVSLWHAINGCTSQFSVSDINFFLEYPIVQRERNKEYQTLNEKLTRAGVEIQWVASPETMRRIVQALEQQRSSLVDKAPSPIISPVLWQERIKQYIMQNEAGKEMHSEQKSRAAFL